MKKIFAFLLLALVAIVAAPAASAYNEMAAELAQALNQEMASQGGSVEYNGTDIILNITEAALNADEAAAMEALSGSPEMESFLKEMLKASIGGDDASTLSAVLTLCQANLVIKWNFGSNPITITLTPADFQ